MVNLLPTTPKHPTRITHYFLNPATLKTRHISGASLVNLTASPATNSLLFYRSRLKRAPAVRVLPLPAHALGSYASQRTFSAGSRCEFCQKAFVAPQRKFSFWSNVKHAWAVAWAQFASPYIYVREEWDELVTPQTLSASVFRSLFLGSHVLMIGLALLCPLELIMRVETYRTLGVFVSHMQWLLMLLYVVHTAHTRMPGAPYRSCCQVLGEIFAHPQVMLVALLQFYLYYWLVNLCALLQPCSHAVFCALFDYGLRFYLSTAGVVFFIDYLRLWGSILFADGRGRRITSFFSACWARRRRTRLQRRCRAYFLFGMQKSLRGRKALVLIALMSVPAFVAFDYPGLYAVNAFALWVTMLYDVIKCLRIRQAAERFVGAVGSALPFLIYTFFLVTFVRGCHFEATVLFEADACVICYAYTCP